MKLKLEEEGGKFSITIADMTKEEVEVFNLNLEQIEDVDLGGDWGVDNADAVAESFYTAVEDLTEQFYPYTATDDHSEEEE